MKLAFKRARSQSQIETRKHEIILAASQIYDELGYEGLSFTSIAQRTDFTRSSIYNYFKTKEEILILILINDLDEWRISFGKEFKLNTIYSIKDVGNIWTNCLMQQERLIELNSILFTIIAKNVSSDYLIQFEEASDNNRKQMSKILAALFPKASQEKLINFIFSAFALALGQFPMAKVDDMTKKEHSETEVCVDFKDNYLSSIYQLLYGLEHSISVD